MYDNHELFVMLKKDSDERLTTSRIKKKVLHLKMDIILHSSIENDLRGLSQFINQILLRKRIMGVLRYNMFESTMCTSVFSSFKNK